MKIEVTYTDLDKSAPRVEYRGAVLLDGIKTDVTAIWSLSDVPENNPWFETVISGASVIEPAPEPEPELMTATRAALVQQAEALGLRVDGRWSDATLMARIEEAGA